jgi:hypothetical protein
VVLALPKPPLAPENRHFSPPGKNISHARSGVLSDERPGE